MNLNSILGYTLYKLSLLRKNPLNHVLSLYFHNPNPQIFERIIKWCIEREYEFIELSTLLDIIKGENQSNKKYVYISFDDGWKGNLDLIPIIEKYNIPITIFVPILPLQDGNFWWEYVSKKYTSNTFKTIQTFKTYPETKFRTIIEGIKKEISIERSAMTLEQLKDISAHPLINIQCHSYSHPILTNLSDQSLDYELKGSKEFLENILSKEINAFSYPNGSLTEREVNRTKQYYTCAFSTIQGYPKAGDDLYMIKRISLTNNYWSNLAKITGGWFLITKLKMKFIKLIIKKNK